MSKSFFYNLMMVTFCVKSFVERQFNVHLFNCLYFLSSKLASDVSSLKVRESLHKQQIDCVWSEETVFRSWNIYLLSYLIALCSYYYQPLESKLLHINLINPGFARVSC